MTPKPHSPPRAPVVVSRGYCRIKRLDDFASGALRLLLADFEPEPLPVQLVTASAAHRSSRLVAFLDHATKRCARSR